MGLIDVLFIFRNLFILNNLLQHISAIFLLHALLGHSTAFMKIQKINSICSSRILNTCTNLRTLRLERICDTNCWSQSQVCVPWARLCIQKHLSGESWFSWQRSEKTFVLCNLSRAEEHLVTVKHWSTPCSGCSLIPSRSWGMHTHTVTG